MREKQNRKHNTVNAVSHRCHYFYWGFLDISEVADVSLPCSIPWYFFTQMQNENVRIFKGTKDYKTWSNHSSKIFFQVSLEKLVSGRIHVHKEKYYIVTMQNTKPLTMILGPWFFWCSSLFQLQGVSASFQEFSAFLESSMSTGIQYHWIFKW